MSIDLIRKHCKTLRLPTMAEVVDDLIHRSVKEDWSVEEFALHWLEEEMAGRRERRITRLTTASHLPEGKTLDTFDQNRLPLRIRRQLPELREGGFIDRAENILIFGMPGTGKPQPEEYPSRVERFLWRECGSHRSSTSSLWENTPSSSDHQQTVSGMLLCRSA
jgi:hypothetical protein